MLYDVKDWLSSHPGGGDILKKNGSNYGKDATIVYQTLHSHSDWAHNKKMKTFKIKPGPFLIKKIIISLINRLNKSICG